ncbi:MAG: histidine phosphatase family protein [Campylobacterales bacterium]|nr:histidine phosphatase family protein [Campylobacterales bacterium]
MKRLFIIRHAKSSWRDLSLDDLDRPLNKRGRRDASFMGKFLKNKGISPDIIISSPALRAKKTAISIASELKYKKEILFDKDIYDKSAMQILEKIKMLDDKYESIFLFGHNPELNKLSNIYVGFDQNIVTCGVLEIEFSCNKWIEVEAINSKLISYDYPKKYN